MHKPTYTCPTQSSFIRSPPTATPYDSLTTLTLWDSSSQHAPSSHGPTKPHLRHYNLQSNGIHERVDWVSLRIGPCFVSQGTLLCCTPLRNLRARPTCAWSSPGWPQPFWSTDRPHQGAIFNNTTTQTIRSSICLISLSFGPEALTITVSMNLLRNLGG
jgi:hypothetical protein